jgi:sec-independent protein translocase protein TatA
MDSLGVPELMIILVIIVLLFGVGRLGKVGKELGTAISEFRKGLNEGKDEATTEPDIDKTASDKT